MNKTFVWGSVEHQKEVAKSIGYDTEQWNGSKEQNEIFYKLIVEALLSGEDITGKQLSPDDISLLANLSGRGG